MIKIKTTHPYSYRQGEWANLIGVEWFNNRICYLVEFPDTKRDHWPVYDKLEPYEFKNVFQMEIAK